MGAWSSRPTAHAVAGVLWMLRHELKPTSNWEHELGSTRIGGGDDHPAGPGDVR